MRVLTVYAHPFLQLGRNFAAPAGAADARAPEA